MCPCLRSNFPMIPYFPVYAYVYMLTAIMAVRNICTVQAAPVEVQLLSPRLKSSQLCWWRLRRSTSSAGIVTLMSTAVFVTCVLAERDNTIEPSQGPPVSSGLLTNYEMSNE